MTVHIHEKDGVKYIITLSKEGSSYVAKWTCDKGDPTDLTEDEAIEAATAKILATSRLFRRVAPVLATVLVMAFFYACAYLFMAEKTYLCYPKIWSREWLHIWPIHVSINDPLRIERVYREKWKRAVFTPAAWVETTLRNTEVWLIGHDPGEDVNESDSDDFNVEKRKLGWPNWEE